MNAQYEGTYGLRVIENDTTRCRRAGLAEGVCLHDKVGIFTYNQECKIRNGDTVVGIRAPLKSVCYGG